MTIFKHELRQGRNSLLIWTAVISLMIAMCIFIFPDMASDMDEIGTMFSNMGSFSAAFGMDKINFGEFIGFFCVECGNILGLGGAFYAALTGIQALGKEEKGHTAEFLLTHPISRTRVIWEKLLAVAVQIVILNAVTILATVVSIFAIGESPQTDTMALLFAAYFLMQLEIAAITFGISAFLRHSGPGIGLGIAALSYFLNIAANLTDKAEFLKYITPFGYTEGADIMERGALNAGYLATGIAFGIIGIFLAFYHYTKKDITA